MTTTQHPAARPIVIATAIVGGIVLASAGTSAAFGLSGFGSGGSGGASTDTTLTADATGATAVDVEVDAAEFTVVYGDVETATLELSGPRSDLWTLDRRGDTLVVDANDRFWDFCFGWCRTDAQTVVLTLPEELEDAKPRVDLELAAGSATAVGAYGVLDLEVGAGKVVAEGSARALDLSMSAGSATIDLADVEMASFEISAGNTTASLTGSAPRAVDIEVSAGSLTLGLPDDTYRVASEVAAGSVQNGLRTAADAPRTITAEVSAGRVTLTPEN